MSDEIIKDEEMEAVEGAEVAATEGEVVADEEVSSEEEISVLLNVLRKERPNVIKMMEEDF